MTELSQSNSLADLAARIKSEHEAAAASLKRGAGHAMAAGDLLMEAKALVKHGEWLPWLKANCEMSERTARLYMRLARNRPEIEAKTATVADLNLRGALALISLPGDNNIVKLGDNIAELADSESIIAAYEKAEAERNTRKALFDNAEAALQRIIEFCETRPAAVATAETIWQDLGDELMLAITATVTAIESDINVPFACSPQATVAADKAEKLALQMLNRIETEAA